MASAVQIMSFIARIGAEGTNSESIAKSLQTNPVVVRRLLKPLERDGLVNVRRGRSGGVSLGRAPEDITLGHIYTAVERDAGVFALREAINRRCPVARGMEALLPAIFEAASAAVEASLGRTSLAQMVRDVG